MGIAEARLTERGKLVAPYVSIGRLSGMQLRLSEVFRRLHGILAGTIAAKNLYIALVEEGHRLRFPYFADETGAEDQLDIFPWEGITAWVIDRGSMLCASREPRVFATIPMIGRHPVDWAGVPLRSRTGSPSGLLCVQSYDEGSRYSDGDLELLEFAAMQLSTMIQLHNYDRDLATRRIASLLDETSDLEPLYAGVHEIVSTLIPAARNCFVIARVDEAAGRFLPVFWRDTRDNWDDIDWPLDRGISSYICSTSHASFIFEKGRTRLPEGLVSIGSIPEYWLGVPLLRGHKVIGVVIVQSYDPDEPITREDEASLNAVAPHIADAISRTELFTHTRRIP